MDFRAAHHWLRGYSDALRHIDEEPKDLTYSRDYFHGYTRGLKARAAWKEAI